VTIQPQVSATVTPGKSPWYALNRKFFGLEAGLDVWKREKYFAHGGFQTPDPLTRCIVKDITRMIIPFNLLWSQMYSQLDTC